LVFYELCSIHFSAAVILDVCGTHVLAERKNYQSFVASVAGPQ